MTSSPSPAPGCLNLGIVAHVDAGKTSLTERLLSDAGVLDVPGSVDAGTTRTDSLELERRRGITIRAAVTSFPLASSREDLLVNLIDTPGHPDFIAEVERSLTVLDAAVLVVSSVEGVQPQTVAIWRALRRLGLPTVLFCNKIDRSTADVERVAGQLRRRLSPAVVTLSAVGDPGESTATTRAIPLESEEVVAVLADHDDRVLARWVEDRPLPSGLLRSALRTAVQDAAVFPLVAGSAITGAGTDQLRSVIAELLPGQGVGRSDSEPPAGTVFAVDRDDHGRRAWIRMWSGELRRRQRVGFGDSPRAVVTELLVSRPEGPVPAGSVRAGEIAAVRGPAARIGDVLGVPPQRRTHAFPAATMQALVSTPDPSRRGTLFSGLTELADEDPLIGLSLDELAGEARVSLHGEVQKEVIASLLAERYGVTACFSETTAICLERVDGNGHAVDRIKAGGNPYLATVGLRVEAAPVGHGVTFSPGIERGNLPPAFIAATEEGVRAGLIQGLAGWQVTDCVVSMTESGYWPRQSRPHQKFDKSISSVAADFRYLAPVVLHAALRQAGTTTCEPVDRVELELPEPAYAGVVALLGRLGGRVVEAGVDTDRWLLSALLPAREVPALASRLPDLTSGEGLLTSRLDHHVAAAGRPARRRTGWDPGDRDEWFREVTR